MKIRSGFVSNSSSSSFIFALPKIDNIEDLYKHINVKVENDHKVACHYETWNETVYITFHEFIDSIYNNIKDEGLATLEDIASNFSGDVYFEMYKLEYQFKGSTYISLKPKSEISLPQEFEDFIKIQIDVDKQVAEYRNSLNIKGWAELKYASEAEREANRKLQGQVREYQKKLEQKYNCTYEDKMKLVMVEAEKRAKVYLDEHAGLSPYIINYSDNDGNFSCAMEHSGGIERHLNAIRINHH